jgi:hypothetical protein
VDFCGALFVLAIVFGMVTLLGHGIWVVFAYVFEALFASERPRSSPNGLATCPGCGQAIPSWKKRCPGCGLESFGTAAGELTDLAATARQLQRFSNDGLLSPEELEHLNGTVRTRQRRLMGLEEPPSYAPSPPPLDEAIPEALPAAAPLPPLWAMTAVELPAAEEAQPPALAQGLAAPPPTDEILDVIPIAIEAAEPPAPAGAAEPPPQEAAPPPVVVPRRRRSLAEVLAAFMEERNILWGELLGGLLIVGCSIALVISLWQQVEKIPYYPFIIFGTITAALFGAGLYTLHHWKLASTSWGLLVIATLLVPLNFLVVAGLHRGDPNRTAADLVIELGVTGVFVSVFFVLLQLAGRVLIPGHRWLLPIAVLGTSASQLLVSAFIDPEQPTTLARFALLGLLPTALSGLSLGQAVRQTARQEPLEEPRAKILFGFLGISSFALTVALGFQAYRTADIATALHWLAPLVALAGVGPLAVGLLAHRRLEEPGQAATRVAGTIVALLGAVVMLAAVGMAWPLRLFLVLVCAINFAILTRTAFHRQLPVLHAAALPCLALGYLTAYHSLAGHIRSDSGGELLRAIVSSRSGTALAVLVALLGLTAEAVSRLGLRQHGAWYAGGAGILALVSLAMVSAQGVEDPLRATIIYGLFGAGSLALNFRWRRIDVSYIGLGLLLGASFWYLPWHWPERLPIWAATLAVEALVFAGLRFCGERSNESPSATPSWNVIPAFFAQPLGHWALIAGSLALALGAVAECWGAWPGYWSAASPWLHGLTAAALAAAAFLLAWSLRRDWLAWLGSALVLSGLTHAFIGNAPSEVWPRDFVLALLSHATLLAPIGALLHRRNAEDASTGLRFYAEPLELSGLLTALVAVPLLGWPVHGPMVIYAGLTLWLAGFWLVIACLERWPALFAAFQAALFVAVGYAVTAWLERQPFAIPTYPESLWDPRSLQAYGVGLGLLCLVWIVVRISVRHRPIVQAMLATPWAFVDRLVLALLVGGQLALALWGICPSVVEELTPMPLLSQMQAPSEPFSHAFGPGAWVVLGILTVVLLTSLWDRCSEPTIFGAVLLAISVPVLVAGPFANVHATAIAWRWGLAACFLVASAALWLRESLGRQARRLRIRLAPGNSLAFTARWSSLLLCVLPVLLLTAIPVALRLGGEQLLRPAEGSFFQRFGSLGSYAVPLGLVALALVGHALRERSAGYAFAGGLITTAIVSGGYALHVVTSQGVFTQADVLRLLQLGTISAGFWGLLWLASRRWVTAWREDAPLGRPLMSGQLGLAALGNAVLLLGGVGSLVAWFPPNTVAASEAHYVRAAWAAEVGSVWTWLALGVAAAGGLYRSRQRGAVPPWAMGSIGLGTVALLACSIERWTVPGWGYRIIMLGSAIFAIGWATHAAKRWQGEVPAEGGARDKADDVVLGVLLANVAAVVLGLKAAIWHHDHLWAAAAIALASAASAVVTVWRRREEWALGAGLLMSLAASLIVWHFHLDEPLSQWWYYLLQANSAAGGLAALIWLAARKRIYGDLELKLSASPLLATQIALTFLCNLAWLGLALAVLVVVPDPGPSMLATLADFGGVGGCLAVLLPMIAGLWYAQQVAPRSRLPAAVIHGLAFGVLLACIVCGWDTGNWLGFHVLQIGWSTIGLLTLALGILTITLRAAQATISDADSDTDPQTQPSWLVGLLDFSEEQAQRWVEIIGCLVVLLVLRGAGSTVGGAYWSPAVAVTVAIMAVGLALWSRRPRFVYESGLVFDLIAILIWLVHGPFTFAAFVAVNIIGVALASAFWSALELMLRTDALAFHLRRWSVPFHQLTAFLALLGIGFLAALAVLSDLANPGAGLQLAHALTWIGVAVSLLAVLLGLWDAQNRWATAGLYVLGIETVLLLLYGPDLAGRLFRDGSLLFAGYVVFTTIIDRLFDRLELARALRVPDRSPPLSNRWFASAQQVTAYVVVALGIGLTLNGESLADRLRGIVATALLVPAGALLGRPSPQRDNRDIRQATLFLGAILLAQFGWALLGLEIAAPWLHRSVVLMAALTVMMALCSERWRHWSETWASDALALRPLFAALAGAMLIVVLVLEAAAYEPAQRRAPTEVWAIVLVAAALLAAVGAALRIAVRPQQDPLRLSDSRRPLYVYGAELLLVLLVVHLRLTVPQLFSGLLAAYWTFVIMAIAFAWVGISELVKRRGLTVLSEPLERTGLFLPLLPILAFWVHPGHLGFVDSQPHTFDRYAVTWFLVSGLYAVVAALRKSFRFAFLAALAGNFGLWSIWHHTGLSFLVHPQLWLIPIALVVLVAEHLNHDRLSRLQSLNLRYAALGMIYLSSTADMFIAGLGNSVMLPLWLMVLSIAGVLLGISLQVRAYLFLGIGFLCVDIFSMIWNAAVNLQHTWVWWASGIVLGVAILSLFAVFEKRRNDVLLMLEQIKGWR